DRARAGVPRLSWAAVRSPGPSSMAEAIRLRAAVERARPDVIHLHASKAGLAGRLAPRRRTPVLFQPHGWSWLAVTGALRTASLAWERAAAHRTDLLVCVGGGGERGGRGDGGRGRGAGGTGGRGVRRPRPVRRGRKRCRPDPVPAGR